MTWQEERKARSSKQDLRKEQRLTKTRILCRCTRLHSKMIFVDENAKQREWGTEVENKVKVSISLMKVQIQKEDWRRRGGGPNTTPSTQSYNYVERREKGSQRENVNTKAEWISILIWMITEREKSRVPPSSTTFSFECNRDGKKNNKGQE